MTTEAGCEIVDTDESNTLRVNEYGEAIFFEDPENLDRLGTHDVCLGDIRRINVSKTHDALHCSKCGLRIILPNSTKTIEELRKHFEQFHWEIL